MVVAMNIPILVLKFEETTMTKILFSVAAAVALGLAACAPTAPVKDFTSQNGISLKYSAFDEIPTLTPEAQDMAIQHCAQYGKFANYRGANAPNPLTAEEVHRFVCEKMKTDDSEVIAAQS